jgi:hypothetical protein
VVDVASLRDDVQMLTRIVLRQPAMLADLIREMRAIRTQIQRMNDRIRQLETADSS